MPVLTALVCSRLFSFSESPVILHALPMCRGQVAQFAREELQNFGVTNFKSSFLYTNTHGRGWMDQALPVMYCNAIRDQAPDVIVTHSMVPFYIREMISQHSCILSCIAELFLSRVG